MRIPGRAALTACTLALAAVLLAACTPAHSDTDPTKTPKLTPTPVFTSDADALAAATATYKKFMALSDQVGHDGGTNPDRVGPYVGQAVLDTERIQAQKLIDAHARSYGETKVSNSRLQSVEQTDSGVEVTIYACSDLSGVDVRDASGKSLIDSSRADLVAYQVVLQGKSADSLRITTNKYWTGGGVCAS